MDTQFESHAHTPTVRREEGGMVVDRVVQEPEPVYCQVSDQV